MWRAISGTIVITAMLALGVWATSAQSQQMPGPGSPSNAWTIGLVEGTVKSVDPATGTVRLRRYRVRPWAGDSARSSR